MKKQTENLKLNYPELEDFEFNNIFEMQEKFITKLVLDYLSDVCIESAKNFELITRENITRPPMISDIVIAISKAVENVRNKYES